jgi:hypothetical protein
VPRRTGRMQDGAIVEPGVARAVGAIHP